MPRGAREKVDSMLPIQRDSLSEGVFRTWMHEPFLERMSDERFRDRAAYTLGAFLVLRLIDRYSVQVGGTHPDALAYQEEATLDYVLKLNQGDAEAGHLMELLRVSKVVREGGGRSLLWGPLLAYAYWLEHELRLKEALDVVDTALRMDDGTAPEREVAALLQGAYLLRLLGRFEAAQNRYARARCRAERMGDSHTVLLSRIGEANVLRQVGNLPAAERALRRILNEAQTAGDRDAQARACHDLAVVIAARGRDSDALGYVLRAFELYLNEELKMRALSDIGEILKRVGELECAAKALQLVAQRSQSSDMKSVAEIGLMELYSLEGNRFAFLRQKGVLQERLYLLPPERAVDFHLQAGLGHLRLGEIEKALPELKEALRLAECHGLNEYVFRIESAINQFTAPKESRDFTIPKPVKSRRPKRPVVARVEKKLHAMCEP